MQNGNHHCGPAVSRSCLGMAPGLLDPRCPAVFTKGVKSPRCPTLSIPAALNSSREESLQAERSPRFCFSNTRACVREPCEQASATLWSSDLKLAGWKLCFVRYFFFLFLREKKGWEVVNTVTPPKTFTKATGVFFQREGAMVGITCQPVHPEEIKSPAPGEGR